MAGVKQAGAWRHKGESTCSESTVPNRHAAWNHQKFSEVVGVIERGCVLQSGDFQAFRRTDKITMSIAPARA
jgi:hypothetical protein